MKQLKVFDFDDIFRFAEKEYGIGWNPCNDLFFNNSLEYGKHTTICPADWRGYIGVDVPEGKKASDFTKEEVAKMDSNDRSYVILKAYFESLGIDDGEVLVDCT